MDEGFVYVLTNEAMPGFVKIGLTRHDNVSIRVRQLHNTSTPLPFECYYAARVPDCRKLERTLHFVFGERRVAKNKEFFKIQPDLAKAIIELVAIEQAPLTDTQQDISHAQRIEIDEIKTVRARVTLASLGLTPGTTLVFSKDPAITCQVTGPRSVFFRGQTLSLSAAALIVIREMGYNWPSVSGFEYWMADDVKLGELGAAEGSPASASPSV